MSVPQIPPPDPRKRPGRYTLYVVDVPAWRPADPHELPDTFVGGARLAGGLTLSKAVQTAGFYNAHAAAGQRVVVVVGPKPVRGSEGRDATTGAT